MSLSNKPSFLLVLALAGAAESRAAPYELTLERAIELARTRAPAVLAARAGIEQARSRVTGASIREPFNPELELAAGPRRRRGEAWSDLELGGRRGARIQEAGAGIERAAAEAEDVERGLVRRAAGSFLSALHAELRLGIVRENERLARELVGASLEALLRGAARRADLRALEAAVREAEAGAALARGYTWPEAALALRYEREEGADVVLGGVTVSLPALQRCCSCSRCFT
jgi:cobalt-zinc-cadmium efflux system outer membrane protein